MPSSATAPASVAPCTSSPGMPTPMPSRPALDEAGAEPITGLGLADDALAVRAHTALAHHLHRPTTRSRAELRQYVDLAGVRRAADVLAGHADHQRPLGGAE
jgi:hypothetical protein